MSTQQIEEEKIQSSPETEYIKPEAILKGKYNDEPVEFTILKTIGQGKFGKVKLARDSNGQPVAIKFMMGHMTEGLLQSIGKEIEILKQLKKHDNVVNYISHGDGEYIQEGKEPKTLYYIAMELSSGGELFDYIVDKGRLGEDISRYFF